MHKMNVKTYGMLVVMLSLVACTQVQAGPVGNGNFSTPGLMAWTVESGSVSDGGGYARFEEHPIDLANSLVQVVTLPANAMVLSFDVSMSATPGGDDLLMPPDAFVATLYDNPVDLNPLISIPGYNEFFYMDNAGVVDDSIVNFDGTTVSLNISGLAGQDVLLAFDLLGSADGMITTVALDNVDISTQAIPAPGALILAVIGVGLHGARRRARK